MPSVQALLTFPARAVRRAFASDFVRSVGETYATRIALVFVGIGATMIIARILGPEGRGQFAAAAAVGAMGVRFGNLGLHASNTYYLSRDRALVAPLLANSLLVSFGFVGVLTVLAGGTFARWPQLAPVEGWMLVLALSSVPFGLACLLIQNLLIAVREVHAYNQIELGSRVLGIVFVGVVIALGVVSPETVFLTTVVTTIVALLGSSWRLRVHCDRLAKPSWALLRSNVHYSLNAYAADVFGSIVLRIDLLMIQYMRGATETGYYSVAAAMAELLYMLPMVVGVLLFPRLSALESPAEKWSLACRTAGGVAAVVGSLALAAVLLAGPAVRIVFGSAFLPAVPAFVWLMPGIVFLSAGSIFQNYLGATGNARGMIYGPLLAAVTNVIANFYLIDHFGIVGAAWSSTGCYGLLALVAWLISRRSIRRGGGEAGSSEESR